MLSCWHAPTSCRPRFVRRGYQLQGNYCLGVSTMYSSSTILGMINLSFFLILLCGCLWHDVGYFHKTAHSFWLFRSRKSRLLKYLDISNSWTINIPDIDSNMVVPLFVLLNPTPFFLWFSMVKIIVSSWFRWLTGHMARLMAKFAISKRSCNFGCLGWRANLCGGFWQNGHWTVVMHCVNGLV